MISLEAVMELARTHAPFGIQADSAKFCLADAEAARERGDWNAYERWALRSLSYSIGILHPDYRRASEGRL